MANDSLTDALLKTKKPLSIPHHESLDGDPRLLRDHLCDRFTAGLFSAASARARASKIKDREREIGEDPIAHKALPELDRGVERLIFIGEPVVFLIIKDRAFDDRSRRLKRGLLHVDTREAPLKRRIALNGVF